ncbi:MAG: hypothetical protein PHN64_03915 [Desulfovibrionaceae bacterium]|nr:hypothetical protein [Desulfovibrionaceae bacterium]
MKAPIVKEILFFLSLTGMSARGLAREAGVTPSTVLHVVSGNRFDMTSTNADKLRAAMARLAAATHSDFGDIEHKIHEKP